MAKKGVKGKEAVKPRLIENRRARHDFTFVETFEAGIALVGSEVKSIFLGKAHLTDAYARVANGELWLFNADVEPYENAAHFQPDRRRDRKLLMHRKQIDTLERKAQEKGLTIIPTRIYFNERGRVKVQIALARGRAEYDKREKLAAQDTRRELERARSERF